MKNNITIRLKKPFHCSIEEIENFYSLVVMGGQVDKQGLRRRIESAQLLAFCYHDTTLVGVAALKRPSENYKEKIFEKAQVYDQSTKYELEVGWAFTKIEERGQGICTILISSIVNSTEQNIFATTRTENQIVQRILEKNGFRRLGKPFRGRTDEYFIQLFSRNKT